MSNIPPNPYTSNWSAERPDEVQLAAEHQAKEEQQGNRLKAAGGTAVGLGLIALKFKGLLLLLLNLKWLLFFGKFFTFGWTFLLSIWIYGLFFGWRFGLVVVLMIAAHELGHYFAFRGYGLKASLPTFIPLFGAFTAGEVPPNAEQHAYIALAGPLTGLGVAAGAYALGLVEHQPFWIAAAYLGAFINLLNMVPTPPFDGGGIAAVLSPRIWIFGFAAFVVLAAFLHLPIIFVLLLAVLGLPRAIAGFKGHYDPAYYALNAWQRLGVGTWYLLTAFGLVWLMSVTHISVNG